MSVRDAKWAFTGVIAGGVLAGVFSVYVEFIKDIRDDIRMRTDKAYETSKMGAQAVVLFSERQVVARKKDPSLLPATYPIECDHVLSLVTGNFPNAVNTAEKFLITCENDLSAQHGVSTGDIPMSAEATNEYVALTSAYKKLRDTVNTESRCLNTEQSSHWYVIGLSSVATAGIESCRMLRIKGEAAKPKST